MQRMVRPPWDIHGLTGTLVSAGDACPCSGSRCCWGWTNLLGTWPCLGCFSPLVTVIPPLGHGLNWGGFPAGNDGPAGDGGPAGNRGSAGDSHTSWEHGLVGITLPCLDVCLGLVPHMECIVYDIKHITLNYLKHILSWLTETDCIQHGLPKWMGVLFVSKCPQLLNSWF